MQITLPSSRSKHYLTGMDWMIRALDYSSRKCLGCGTAFQIVMELSSVVNSAELEKYLTNYCSRFPYLSGKVARDFNLAPYWKPQSPKESFKLKVILASSPEDIGRQHEIELQRPFKPGAFPFRAVYIHVSQKQSIGFIFEHGLFDARGAEQFLQDFQTFYLKRGNISPSKPIPAPAHLDHWAEKFAAGKKVNRARIAQTRERQAQLAILKKSGSMKETANLFRVKTFDEEKTREILGRAGPFMFLPYGLAVSIRAMRALFVGRGEENKDLAVSVTRDMRPVHGKTLPEIFFNHLSFMFFRVNLAEAENFDLLLAHLKNQFYEQVKTKMPEALAEASMLMRILPLAVLSCALETPEYAPASFSFASLGESVYRHEKFMEANVERLFHMPRLPPSPGFGIFFSQYKKKLNVTLSYLDGLVSEEEAGRIWAELDTL